MDFPSHLWLCRLDAADPQGPSLVTAKQAPYFDREINVYIERAGVGRPLDPVLDGKFEHRVIRFHWSGGFRLCTEGEFNPWLR